MSEQRFEVRPDPSIEASAADYKAKQQLVSDMFNSIDEIYTTVNGMMSIRDQVAGLIKATADHPAGDEIGKKGHALKGKDHRLD